MKILVNGSSVSHGEGTWPYYLQQSTGHDLINLSMAGAGNTYIADSTIAELAERSYDLVVIMWAEHNRMDFKIDRVAESFPTTEFTSLYQSQFVPDQSSKDLIQKDWVFGVSYLGQTPADNTNALFKGYYTYSDHNQRIFSSLIKIISLQSVLQTLQVPYVFLSFKNMVGHHRFPHLDRMIDWSKFDQEKFLFSLAKENNLWDDETRHPKIEAHKIYSKYLIQRIQEIS